MPILSWRGPKKAAWPACRSSAGPLQGVKTGFLTHTGRPHPHPARLAIRYALAGIVWVVVSEYLLAALPIHSLVLNRLLFVSVTTVLLFIVASRYAHTLQFSITVRDEALARMRGYFDSSVEGIVTADSAGLIRQVNPRAQELFGYREVELLGHPIEVLIPERYRKGHPALRDGFHREGRSRAMGLGREIVAIRKDGTEFPAEITVNHVPTHRGDLAIAFVSDVTERRAMEREARRSETLNALGAVATGIAHELNNPLAVIASRIEVMLMPGQELPPELRQDLMVLQRNVERASRISQNLLSLARQRPGVRQPLDINKAIEEAVVLLRNDSRGTRLNFDLDLNRTLPQVIAEPTSLEQVLINLVSNARDAGATNVSIRTTSDLDRPNNLQITIADDGEGIAPAALERLFQPFFTTKPKGTGLGLWLSRRMVQDHGGIMEVKSELGKGTTFTILLPVRKAAPAAIEGDTHVAK
jgi:PAS domain S-box-containing protein